MANGGTRARTVAGLGACALALAGAGCGSVGAPELALAGVSPEEVAAGVPVELTIEGRGFAMAVHTRLADEAEAPLPPEVEVGGVALKGLVRQEDGRLAGQLPGTLPPGVYPVTVRFGPGREATLAQGLRVVAPVQASLTPPTDLAPGEPVTAALRLAARADAPVMVTLEALSATPEAATLTRQPLAAESWEVPSAAPVAAGLPFTVTGVGEGDRVVLDAALRWQVGTLSGTLDVSAEVPVRAAGLEVVGWTGFESPLEVGAQRVLEARLRATGSVPVSELAVAGVVLGPELAAAGAPQVVPASLAPGEEARLTVPVTGLASGTASVRVDLVTGAARGEAPAPPRLSGEVVLLTPPLVAVSPATVPTRFEVDSAAPVTLRLDNRGEVALVEASLTVAASEGQVSPASLALDALAAGDGVSVPITVTPAVAGTPVEVQVAVSGRSALSGRPVGTEAPLSLSPVLTPPRPEVTAVTDPSAILNAPQPLTLSVENRGEVEVVAGRLTVTAGPGVALVVDGQDQPARIMDLGTVAAGAATPSVSLELVARAEGARTVAVAFDGQDGLTDQALAPVTTEVAFEVVPPPPAALTLTGPDAALAGACLGPITVGLQDAAGHPTVAPTILPVSLSVTGGTAAVFSDPACTAPTATLQVPEGETGGVVYLHETVAGDRSVTASATGLASATHPWTVGAAAPARVVFTSAPGQQEAGACGPEATVALLDAYGNQTTAPTPLTLDLSADAPDLTFHLDEACAGAASGLPLGTGDPGGRFRVRALRAGTATLTVGGPGLASATQVWTVSPGAPAELVVTTEGALEAGACLPIQADLVDAHGNPAPLAGNDSLALGTDTATMRFYGDAACAGGQVTQLDLTAGATGARVFVSGVEAGTATLTLGVGGLLAVAPVTVQPGPPAGKRFVTPPRTVVAGTCSEAVTIELHDAYGNRTLARDSLSLSLAADGSASLGFATGPGCGDQVTAVTLPAGAGAATVHFRDSSSGSPEVIVSSALGEVRQGQTVLAGAPAALAFETAPEPLTAGTCSPVVVVGGRDAHGNPTPLSPGSLVELSSDAGTLGFHLQAACDPEAVSVTQAQVGADGRAAFHLTDTRAGSPTIQASLGSLTAAEQGWTVGPSAPSALVPLTPSPVALEAGECSPALVLELQDPWGNPSPAQDTVGVSLASTSGTLSFHAGVDCAGAPVDGWILAAGATRVSGRVLDPAAGPVTLSFTAAGLSTADLAAQVSPGPASEVVFVSGPGSLTAGACSGSVTLGLRDAHGNPVSFDGEALTLASDDPELTFHTGADCDGAPVGTLTPPAGTTTASVRFRTPRAGAPTLTVTGSGLSPAGQTWAVSAGPPSRLVIGSAVQPVAAGECSATVTAGLVDAYDNPTAFTAPAPLQVSSDSASLTVHPASGCGTPLTQAELPAGSQGLSIRFQETVAGSPALSVLVGGLSATQVQSVVPGAPTGLVAVTPPRLVTAGACSEVVTLELQDAYHNPTEARADQVLTLASDSGTLAFFADAACTQEVLGVTVPTGGRRGSFHFRDPTAGTPTTTVSWANGDPSLQTHQVDPAAPVALRFASPIQALTAGDCSPSVVVEGLDPHGNLAPLSPDRLVDLASDDPTLTFHTDPGCAGAPVVQALVGPGRTTADFHLRTVTAGSPEVRAEVPGWSPAIQTLQVDPGPPTVLAITAQSPLAATAGACAGPLTVGVLDAWGNPAPPADPLLLDLTADSGTWTFHADGTGCGGDPIQQASVGGGGSGVVLWGRDTRAGAGSFTVAPAAAPQVLPASHPFAIQPAPPSVLHFVNPPRTLEAGACSAGLTLESRDLYGNPSPVSVPTVVRLGTVEGAPVQFFGDLLCSVPVSALDWAPGTVRRTFHLAAPTAGTLTLTADADGWTGAVQAQTVDPAPAAALVFVSAPREMAAGACTGPAEVELQDAFGNPLAATSDRTLLLLADHPDLTFHLAAGCLDAPATAADLPTGSARTALWLTDPLAGPVALEVRGAGLAPATQTWTVTPGAPAQLTFTTPLRTVVAGTCSEALSVALTDAHGNPVPAPVDTPLTVDPTSATASVHPDPTCGAGGPVTLPAGGTSVDLHVADTTAGTPTVTVTGGGWTPTSQALTVLAGPADHLAFLTPPRAFVPGVCSEVLEVGAFDAWDNPAAPADPITLSVTSDATSLTVHDDTTCLTQGPVVLPAGGTARFAFLDPVGGTPTLYVSGPGLGEAVQTQVGSGPPEVRIVAPVAGDGRTVAPGETLDVRVGALAGSGLTVSALSLSVSGPGSTPAPAAPGRRDPAVTFPVTVDPGAVEGQTLTLVATAVDSAGQRVDSSAVSLTVQSSPSLLGLECAPSDRLVRESEMLDVRLWATWSDGRREEVGAAASWTVQGTAIDFAKGVVQGAGAGTGALVGTYLGQTGECRFEVTNSPLQLEPERIATTPGVSFPLAFFRWNDGQRIDTGTEAETVWETSDPTVATVGATGLVTVVGPGEATITACYSKRSEPCPQGVTRLMVGSNLELPGTLGIGPVTIPAGTHVLDTLRVAAGTRVEGWGIQPLVLEIGTRLTVEAGATLAVDGRHAPNLSRDSMIAMDRQGDGGDAGPGGGGGGAGSGDGTGDCGPEKWNCGGTGDPPGGLADTDPTTSPGGDGGGAGGGTGAAATGGTAGDAGGGGGHGGPGGAGGALSAIRGLVSPGGSASAAAGGGGSGGGGGDGGGNGDGPGGGGGGGGGLLEIRSTGSAVVRVDGTLSARGGNGGGARGGARGGSGGGGAGGAIRVSLPEGTLEGGGHLDVSGGEGGSGEAGGSIVCGGGGGGGGGRVRLEGAVAGPFLRPLAAPGRGGAPCGGDGAPGEAGGPGVVERP